LAGVAEILSIGVLAPRIARSDSLRCIAATAPQRVISVLRTHKVVSYVGDAVSELEEAGALQPFLVEFRPVLDRRRRRTNLLEAVVELVGTIAARAGIPVYGIKGLAARGWYPRQEWRDLNDLDLYVETADEAWHIAAMLRNEGFQYDREELPWFKVDVSSGRPYGQVAVERGEGDAVTTVDVHFGGYSVRHCGLLPIDTGAGRAGLQALPTLSNLAMLVANVAGDHFITVKDLNDLYLCLLRKDVDWPRLTSLLELAAVYGAFWSMVVQLQSLFDVTPEVREVISTLRTPRTRELLPSLTHRDWRARRLVVARSAWTVGRRSSWGRGLRALVTAVWYYSVSLHPRLTSGSWPRLDLKRRRLNNWSCIRLLPPQLIRKLVGSRAPVTDGRLQESLVLRLGPFSVHRTQRGDLVAIGTEYFIPTISGRFSTAIAAAALAYNHTASASGAAVDDECRDARGEALPPPINR
jgi:hypothetical protein